MNEIDNPRHDYFLPVLIMGLALVIWFGFQATQLLKERENLTKLRENQETTYQNAQKMRNQLDAIAAGTARLAQQGNPQAAQVVAALKARGITINPSGATAQAPKP